MARLPSLPLRSRGLIRVPPPSSRQFHTTPPSRNILFNLGGLAGSRESQYLSRERGIPRTEYSSHIHLIRSSEVNPFAPAPGASSDAAREAQEAEREAAEAASDFQESLDHADPYGQAKRFRAMAAKLEAAEDEIALLKRSIRDMEESYESIRNSAMVWPAVIVAALTMAYIFGDVWRDRSGRGGEIAVAEQPAVRVEDKAQDQESMMAAEDLKRSSDRVASHSQVHERGRGSLLGWLMWAPGSVAK